MIVSSDIAPDKNLYFIGGLILQSLQKTPQNDLDALFSEINSGYEIAFSFYLYALDWLFLLSLIDASEEGEILLCT